ncbi:MAG: hypothetical protein VKJ09_14585 [Leptolyngbya sp.]|nr:hypothetical protein [Leptolyngbya sp.]
MPVMQSVPLAAAPSPSSIAASLPTAVPPSPYPPQQTQALQQLQAEVTALLDYLHHLPVTAPRESRSPSA